MELSDLPEAWRALSPERALALKLIIDCGASDEFRPCRVCGYRIRDPYGLVRKRDIAAGRLTIICSRCDAENYREWKLAKDAEDHRFDGELSPSVCACGKSLKDCTAWKVRCDEPMKPKLRRRSKGQGSLFE